MKKLACLFLVCLSVGLLTACERVFPLRQGEWQRPEQVLRSFYEYRQLERQGTEAVRLLVDRREHVVSLAFYLYSLAQAFERFDRDQDAAKLYLRLLASYPIMADGGQLGIMAENRLRWLIADKSWVLASESELILRLESALRRHDPKALGALVSRDFGFGASADDRFAVNYPETIQLLTAALKDLNTPTVEVVSEVENEKVLLKTTGWEHGTKTWYFTLHRNPKVQGWEWDLAYWDPDTPGQP